MISLEREEEFLVKGSSGGRTGMGVSNGEEKERGR